jgi:hypothetical protein
MSRVEYRVRISGSFNFRTFQRKNFWFLGDTKCDRAMVGSTNGVVLVYGHTDHGYLGVHNLVQILSTARSGTERTGTWIPILDNKLSALTGLNPYLEVHSAESLSSKIGISQGNPIRGANTKCWLGTHELS